MPTTLAGLLVRVGALDQAAADEALHRHLAVGGAIDTVLLEAGAAGELALLQALGEASGLSEAYPDDYAEVDPRVLKLFPFKLADRHSMVPIRAERRHIDVAVAYPPDSLLLEETSFMLGKDLRPQVSLEVRIREAIARLYQRPLPPRYASLLRKLGPAPKRTTLFTAPAVGPAPAAQSPVSPSSRASTPSPVAFVPRREGDSTVVGLKAIPDLANVPVAESAVDEHVLDESSLNEHLLEEQILDIPVQLSRKPPPPPPEPPAASPLIARPPSRERLPAAVPLVRGPEEWVPPPAPPPPAPDPFAIEVEVGAPVALEPSAEITQVSMPLAPVSSEEEDVRIEDDGPSGAVWEPPPAPPPLPTELGPPEVDIPEPTLTDLPLRRAQDSAELQRFLSWEAGDNISSLEEALAAVALQEGVAIHQDGIPSGPVLEPVPRISMNEILGAPEIIGRPPPPSASWTLTTARANLASAPGRDEIIDNTLKFALKSFDYAAALAVRNGTAFGWAATSLDDDPADPSRLAGVHKVALPLDVPSVLRTVLRARGRYLGPLPEDALTQQLLKDLGRSRPRVALIYPVFVHERAVAFFFADRGDRGVSARKVAEFLLYAQELSTAFERAILGHKKRQTSVRAIAEGALLPVPRKAPPAPLKAPVAATPAVASAPPPAIDPSLEETGEFLFPIQDIVPIPPPIQVRSVENLIDDLISPDRQRRVAALSELGTNPEESARALAARFPGPTTIRRGLVAELPEPSDIGPIVGALARLGPAAVPHVARLLTRGNPDQRFFAVLLVGWLKSPDVFPGLATCLFDPVPEVAAAARAASVPVRKVQGFDAVVGGALREELASVDSDRVCAAIRAIGMIRDPNAIPRLIPLAGHAEDRVAAEASEALSLITKQTLGDSPRRWNSWWEGNKTRSRLNWLVEGLTHKDLQIRLSAISELVEETQDDFGFHADGPRKDREKALERWDAWLREKTKRRA